jgi:hypothetical protein
MKTFVVGLLTIAAVLRSTNRTASAAETRPSDYQMMANDAEWPEFEKLDGFRECFNRELRDYQIQITRNKRCLDSVRFQVLDGNGNEVHAWDGSLSTPFVERDGILYYALYYTTTSGCDIVAFDLKRAKRLWQSPLQGTGVLFHSIYYNEVRFGPPEHKEVLMVYGREAGGRYIEIVDLKTGKTVGHKQFPAEKEARPVPFWK